MLKDIDRSMLHTMKVSAQEALQDIEQLQLMLDGEDTYENVIHFKNIQHQCVMSCLNVTGISFDTDRQAEQGTHFETSRLKYEAEQKQSV